MIYTIISNNANSLIEKIFACIKQGKDESEKDIDTWKLEQIDNGQNVLVHTTGQWEKKGAIVLVKNEKDTKNIIVNASFHYWRNYSNDERTEDDEKYLLDLIPETKDVDGFCANNIGLLAMGMPRTISCTPFGVMKLLESTKVDLKGKHAVVVGRSNTVGKPMAMLLLNANCTVTVCHSKTANLSEICRQADILVVAIGKPKFLTADMVKDGAIVIDVGINKVDGKLYGDVDFDDVLDKVSLITPVPGGVGPMTVASLMNNVLEPYRKTQK